MRISMIEDEPDCFKPYETLLRARGHKVTTYTEADDVVNSLTTIAQSDLVILDLMIQLGSIIQPSEASETGIAIYKRLRTVAPKLRIVVVTARVKSQVWPIFESDGNARFLAKPINNLEQFYKTIEEWK